MGEFERRRRRLRHGPAVAPQDDPAAPRPGAGEFAHPLAGGDPTALPGGHDTPPVRHEPAVPGIHGRPTDRAAGERPGPVAETATISDPGDDALAGSGPERRPGVHVPGPAESDRRRGDGVPAAGAAERPVARPGGGPTARRGAGPRPTSGAGAGGFDDRDAERGLRGLVGSGSSQVSVGAAMRARDAARPTDADLAEAEERLVIVRRNWLPREDLPRNR